ncbi:repeat-containing 5-like [Octopus vulgaris]|uniref:Repeat-containing 5-like n=2 Tax=Octopus vulgaris TaxID=6645 RepID=A0AA36BUD9_OCTVU|nr:repeat-containing 5-like [Octopus vulgaris]
MDSVSCREIISRLSWAISNEKHPFDSSHCSSALHQALLKLRTSFSRNKEARNKLIELNIVPKLFSLLKKPQRYFNEEPVPERGKQQHRNGEGHQQQHEEAATEKGDGISATETKDHLSCSKEIGGHDIKNKMPGTVKRLEGFGPDPSSDQGSRVPSSSTNNTEILTSAATPTPTATTSRTTAITSSSSPSAASLSTVDDGWNKSANRWQDDGAAVAGSGSTVVSQRCSNDGQKANDITDLLLSVLGNFCVEPTVRKQVLKYQGIRVLQSILLESNKESIQRRCCRTLANLAMDCACRRIIHKTDITQRIVQLLEYTNDSECQLTYCHTLRLFGDSTQLNKTIINYNGIAVLSRLSKFAPHMVKSAAVKTMADLGRTNCSVEFAQQVLTADGLSTLVEISNQGGTLSQNALRVLIYLSRHNFIRPPLGSSGGIQTMKNKFDDEVSTVRKIEILNALCLFCNEAVNRVKLRQSDVLMLFIEALKDLIYSTLHNRIISALVNFLYDEVSFDMLLERGLVPVLFIHLQRCAGFSFNLPKTEPFVKSLIENIVSYPTKKHTKFSDGSEEEGKNSPSSKKYSKLSENSNSDARLKDSSVLPEVSPKKLKPGFKGSPPTEQNRSDKLSVKENEKDAGAKCVSTKLSNTTKDADADLSCSDSLTNVSKDNCKSSPVNVNLEMKFMETEPVASDDKIHSSNSCKRPLSEVDSYHSSEAAVESESPQMKFSKQEASGTKDLPNRHRSESLTLPLSGEDDDDCDDSGVGCDDDCGKDNVVDDDNRDDDDKDKIGADEDIEGNICHQVSAPSEEGKKKQQEQTPQRYVFRIDSPTYQTDVKWSADNFTDGQTCKQDFGNEVSNGSSALSPFSNSSYHSPDWSPDYSSQLRDDFSSEDSDDDRSQDDLQDPVAMVTSKTVSATGDSIGKEQSSSVASAAADTPKGWRKTRKKPSHSPVKDLSSNSVENEEFTKNLYKKREKMMLSDCHVALRTTENNILVLLSRVSQKENPSKFLATVESFWCLLHYIGKVPFAYPRSIRILSRVVRNPFCFESLITFMAPAMIFLELMTSWDQRKDSQSKLFWTPSRGTMLNFNSAFAVDSYIKDLDDLFKAGQLILNDFSQVAEIHFGNSLLAQHLTKKTPQQDSVVACLPFLCRCRNVQEKLLVKFRGFDLLLNIIKNEPESYLSKVVILGLNYLSRHLNVTTSLQNVDRQQVYPKQTLPGNNSSDTQDCCLSNTKRNTAFVTDNGKKILVNQEAVTSRSEVFSAMLLSDFVEAETHEVKIGYTTPQALEVIVHYLHGCSLKCFTIQQLHWPKTKLTKNDLLNIMGLTDRYMLDNLRKYLACVIFQCYLDEKTADAFYNAAVLHSYNDLSRDCIKYCLGQVCLGKRSIDCLLRFLNGPNHEVFLSSVKEMFIKHIVSENAAPK